MEAFKCPGNSIISSLLNLNFERLKGIIIKWPDKGPESALRPNAKADT
jgi:hypothetical protein